MSPIRSRSRRAVTLSDRMARLDEPARERCHQREAVKVRREAMPAAAKADARHRMEHGDVEGRQHGVDGIEGRVTAVNPGPSSYRLSSLTQAINSVRKWEVHPSLLVSLNRNPSSGRAMPRLNGSTGTSCRGSARRGRPIARDASTAAWGSRSLAAHGRGRFRVSKGMAR